MFKVPVTAPLSGPHQTNDGGTIVPVDIMSAQIQDAPQMVSAWTFRLFCVL